MEYSNTINDEKISAIKAQRGIENMEELYRQLQEAEQQDDEEENQENNGENKEGSNEENKELAIAKWNEYFGGSVQNEDNENLV